jgi:hypothetical protein
MLTDKNVDIVLLGCNAGRTRRFGGTYCLHFQGWSVTLCELVDICSSETLVSTYKSTRRTIQKNNIDIFIAERTSTIKQTKNLRVCNTPGCGGKQRSVLTYKTVLSLKVLRMVGIQCLNDSNTKIHKIPNKLCAILTSFPERILVLLVRGLELICLCSHTVCLVHLYEYRRLDFKSHVSTGYQSLSRLLSAATLHVHPACDMYHITWRATPQSDILYLFISDDK